MLGQNKSVCLLVCAMFLLLGCGKHQDIDISIKEAFVIAAEEVFDDSITWPKKTKMTLTINELPKEWDLLFELEPNSPGLHTRVLILKKGGDVEVLGGL